VWRLGGRRAKAAVRTLGWERAGALVTLFAAPWGPKTPSLATPQFLFASDPIAKHDDDTSDEGPSQRPYETLTALAAKLSLTIDPPADKRPAVASPEIIAFRHDGAALNCATGPAQVPGSARCDAGSTTAKPMS
jgi:hypothetical protein